MIIDSLIISLVQISNNLKANLEILKNGPIKTHTGEKNIFHTF